MVDIVLLEYDLVLLALLLVGMDNIVIVLIKLVERLIHLRGKTMVSADPLSDSLVLFSILLVKDDENEIET